MRVRHAVFMCLGVLWLGACSPQPQPQLRNPSARHTALANLLVTVDAARAADLKAMLSDALSPDGKVLAYPASAGAQSMRLMIIDTPDRVEAIAQAIPPESTVEDRKTPGPAAASVAPIPGYFPGSAPKRPDVVASADSELGPITVLAMAQPDTAAESRLPLPLLPSQKSKPALMVESAAAEPPPSPVQASEAPADTAPTASLERISTDVSTPPDGHAEAEMYIYRARYSSPEELMSTLKGVYGQDVMVYDENEGGYVNIGSHPSKNDVLPRFVPVANQAANAIMIVARPGQIDEIETLLLKMDARPLQVFLDMAIAEITLLDEEFFGTQSSFLSQGQVGVGSETDSLLSLAESTFNAITPTGAQGFQYVVSAPGRLAARFRTLASEDRIKILSDPHIFVANNAQATINIGEQIPVKETIVSGNIVTETVNLQQTGITLTITPRINYEGELLLDVEQIVKEVGSENYGSSGSASFNTRETSTKLVVQDDTSVLIGGLISRERKLSEQGVPILRDIPVLGRLFRARDMTHRRRELVLLITARIMRSPQDEIDETDATMEGTEWWLNPANEEKTEEEKFDQFLEKLQPEQP